MRRMPPSQSLLARLVMSAALRPRPASVSRKSREPLAARLIQGWRRPARIGHGPDGLEAVPNQQQPASCQQVLNRPPAVIWLHTPMDDIHTCLLANPRYWIRARAARRARYKTGIP